jgi:hypothetical protein
MAYETGIASDHLDLLLRFRAFVTGHANLVAAGQAWQELRWVAQATTQELILNARGLAGNDETYCGLISQETAASDLYQWKVLGSTGYLSGANFAGQPGVSSDHYLTLWNSPMRYWLVANGRRAILAVKVSSRYMLMHLGFLTPYATPSQFPYPFFVSSTDSYYFGGRRWSEVSLIWNGQMRNLAGVRATPSRYPSTHAYKHSPGVVYPLTRIVLYDSTALYGEIDGLYHVSGFANASENHITVDGVDHLVLQDVASTGIGNYVALRLE